MNFCLKIGRGPLLCKYIPNSISSCLFLFGFFPLSPSLGCRLASQTAALRTVAGSSTWLLLGRQVLSRLEFFGKLSRTRRAGCSIVGRKMREADLDYAHACVLSHFSYGHPFYLTPAHHPVALRAEASGRRRPRCHTLLVRLQEAFRSARRQVPGPPSRTRCQAA